MRNKISLPVLDDSTTRVARRSVLLIGASAAALTACRADADFGFPGGPPQPSDDAGADSTDDTGSDSGSPPPMDSGSPPPTDSGPPPPTDSGSTCTPGRQSLGTVSSFAMGTWTMNRSLRLVVAHDSGGLYAYTAVCTHQGCLCDPPDASGQLYCGCHGSLFDGNGAVINGPARTPLRHYAVTVCDGTAYVDTTMTVAASTRTPV